MRLAVDPGQTTGLAWRTLDGSLRQLEVPGEAIWTVLWALCPTEIVVEQFRSRPGPAVNLSAPRVIGRIAAWADLTGARVVLQEPSAAKRVIKDVLLRDLGGWRRGAPHARDAARHLFYRERVLDKTETCC